MLASDFIVDRLVRLGVRHVFGVGGANIEDMFAAVQRRRPEIRAVLAKHEHAAGTAADAYARLGGGLGVVLATSGGGAMNLVHSLAEARASRVPVLALIGEPPVDVQGRGAFQDTSGRGGAVDAAAIFGSVASFCARITGVNAIPRLFDEAVAAALGELRGPAVLLLAKDWQSAPMSEEALSVPPGSVSGRPVDRAGDHGPLDDAMVAAASLLTGSLCRAPKAPGPIVIVAGDEVARSDARSELARLAAALDAGVAVTPDARDAFDNRDPRFLGVAGAMGHPAVRRALGDADLCVLIGTRLPLLARAGLEMVLRDKALLSFGRETPFFMSPAGRHVGGDLRSSLSGLLQKLPSRRPASDPVVPMGDPRGDAQSCEAGDALTMSSAFAIIERALPAQSVIIVDAGNTGASAAHHLAAPHDGRWLLAMGMAGMGYAFGAAVGAACATGRRCFALAGDGAFYMHGLDIHTAVEHGLPITYIVFNNSAHGMCLVREKLLLGENAGYNAFRRSHVGAGLSAMFPRLFACDCRSAGELAEALAKAERQRGPSVIALELRDVEIPPFAAFQAAKERAITTVERGTTDEEP